MTSLSVVSTRREPRAVYQNLNVWIVLSLLAVALVTRAGRFGDPAIETDEQFYLLVADSMWHGALPYVDIWDRKPILLFLIYAALRPFSPNGIVAYQVGAALFATTTAFVVVMIARRFASLRGAWLAGVAYLLYLPLLEGVGGQSPVFYNLFLALGGLEVIRAGEASGLEPIRQHGWRSMLWAGLAIQVKYTAAVDGCAFGLWLIVLLAKRNGGSLSKILLQAALWIAVALLPTLSALGFYGLIGHGADFIQANFLSIFQRHEPEGFSNAVFLWESTLRLAFLLPAVIVSGVLLLRRKTTHAPVSFLLLWTCCAVVDFFSIGNYFYHYALPALLPFMILCSPLFETPVGGPAVIAFFFYFSILASGLPRGEIRQLDERGVAAMVQAAEPYVAHGCIYLNDGPPIVYLLTRSCLPTPYVFPGHLLDADEAEATNATRSMATLLAARPSAIFVADQPGRHTPNAITAALLDASLARSYERVAILPDVSPGRHQILYARKDLLTARDAHP